MNFKKIRPPTMGNIFIFIFGVLGCFYGKIIFYPYNLLGVLPLLFGVWFMMSAHSLFVRSKTGVSPLEKTTKLIVSGNYRFTRNPMYLGFLCMYFGIAFIVGSWISFFAPVLFFIFIELFWIPFEEEKMKKQFEKEYLDYKKKVRRWI